MFCRSEIAVWAIAWTFTVWILVRTMIHNLAPLVFSVTGDYVLAKSSKSFA
ncbi:MAG: hypothetical protein PHN99_07025 [Eubacteriales bacterium]|nr:hypothetical protein [Eubacteriales bacterium]MDD4328183.1 hypothetical protein [Eubacteriales bacterium]MDD4717848.1 hypothetical protein [Eubacteriales bacterium]